MKITWTKVGTIMGLAAALSLAPAAQAQVLDERNKVVLRPQERVNLLKDMRNYLRGVQVINLAIARGDHLVVEQTARALGRIAIYEMKPHMTPSLVPTFRRLATEVHESFDMLAEQASAKAEPLELLESLGQLMDRCITCHDTFRVEDY